MTALHDGGDAQEPTGFSSADASDTSGFVRQVAQPFRTLVEHASDVVLLVSPDDVVLYVNPAIERVLGYPPSRVIGTLSSSYVHPDDLPAVTEAFTPVVEGTPSLVTVRFRSRHADGSWRFMEATANDLTVDPAVQGVVVSVRDISERQRAEEERERLLASEQGIRAEVEATQQRVAFLAGASALLASSLDYETTLASVARLAVPRLADWCAIDVAGVDEPFRRLTVASVDPTIPERVQELRRRYPLHPDGLSGVPLVMRTGHPELIPEVSEAQLRQTTSDEGHIAILLSLQMTSILRVPMAVHGDVLGVISLISTRPDRRYSAADLILAEDLGRRAATAIENARLYREEQEALRERDAALARAEAERERLYETFMKMPAAIAVGRGPDHVLAFANPLFFEVTGAQDRVGLPAREVFGNAPSRAYLALLDHVYSTGRTFSRNEVRLGMSRLKPGASDRYFNIVVLATRDASGDVDGVLLHAVEVTEGVEARQRAEALAADNDRLYQETREALRVRDEFLQSISHDLRTPLTPIRTFAQLLAKRARREGGADNEVLLEGLASIDVNTARMSGLIDDLLDLSRLQTGRPLALDLRPVDLAGLVNATAAEFRRLPGGARIEVEAPDWELIGEWDAARLERVVSNLLSNALKYSPDGGPVVVSLAEDPTDRAAVLSVRDQGMGIPEADLPHIFERFRRGSNVTERTSGTGIGLAGAKQIVEQHGGAITVESIEGQRTTVVVRLPRQQP
jgi:PAS domain S-box-containing protein